jgi:hypothetical protein
MRFRGAGQVIDREQRPDAVRQPGNQRGRETATQVLNGGSAFKGRGGRRCWTE